MTARELARFVLVGVILLLCAAVVTKNNSPRFKWWVMASLWGLLLLMLVYTIGIGA